MDILTQIGYDKRKEKNRLNRAIYLIMMNYVRYVGIEAGYRVYHVRSQSRYRVYYKVYVKAGDLHPTCTCRDWGLNDWGDAYLGIPKPMYRCKHGLAVLLTEANVRRTILVKGE